MRSRVPQAKAKGCFYLNEFELNFHKESDDGSAKCNAQASPGIQNLVYGVLFEIPESGLYLLDKVEGLGNGYERQIVTIENYEQEKKDAFIYVATRINDTLKPYSWYVEHVVRGALEMKLPNHYVEQKIKGVESITDLDIERARRERSIYF